MQILPWDFIETANSTLGMRCKPATSNNSAAATKPPLENSSLISNLERNGNCRMYFPHCHNITSSFYHLTRYIIYDCGIRQGSERRFLQSRFCCVGFPAVHQARPSCKLPRYLSSAQRKAMAKHEVVKSYAECQQFLRRNNTIWRRLTKHFWKTNSRILYWTSKSPWFAKLLRVVDANGCNWGNVLANSTAGVCLYEKHLDTEKICSLTYYEIFVIYYRRSLFLLLL